ncbi:MAG: gamma-glutamylcyclotransferase [Rhodopila sp.]
MPLDIVFAYGSLKRGFSNHHVIVGAKFLGAGQTRAGLMCSPCRLA